MLRAQRGLPKTVKELLGFSLIEVLISVSIMGISVLGILGGINFCISTLQSNREWSRSCDILLKQSEELSLVCWDDIQSQRVPTNFYDWLHPDWLLDEFRKEIQTLWLEKNIIDEKELSIDKGMLKDTNSFLWEEWKKFLKSREKEDQLARLNRPNTLFVGTTEFLQSATTNSDFYYSNLVRVLLKVSWHSNGRIRTNSLEFNLGKNNLRSFQEHPVKTHPKDLILSNTTELLEWYHTNNLENNSQ